MHIVLLKRVGVYVVFLEEAPLLVLSYVYLGSCVQLRCYARVHVMQNREMKFKYI